MIPPLDSALDVVVVVVRANQDEQLKTRRRGGRALPPGRRW